MAVRPQLQRRLSVGDMTEIEVASEADEDSLSGKVVGCLVICLCEMFSHQKGQLLVSGDPCVRLGVGLVFVK